MIAGPDAFNALQPDPEVRHSSQSGAPDLLTAVLSTSIAAITVVGRDGRISYANQQARAIFGLIPSSVSGMAFDAPEWRITAVDGGPFPAHDLPFTRIMRTGMPVNDIRHAIEWKDGRRRILSVNGTPLTEPCGTITSVVFSVHDITELHEALNRAEAANTAKSQFLAGMSHELRTPLNAILGFTDLLLSQIKGPLPPNALEYLDIIHRAGDHLLHLINEILDLARIEAGQMTISREPVEVGPLIESCLELTAPLAEERGIALKWAAPSEPVVLGDPGRLRQVLLNLLSNAIKFNRPQGSVTVDAHAGARRLRIRVTDTGPGIPTDRQGELFKTFSRLDSDALKVEGTGIGLALSRHLIELMGGRIDFTSTEGSGSAFWIELPLHHRQP